MEKKEYKQEYIVLTTGVAEFLSKNMSELHDKGYKRDGKMIVTVSYTPNTGLKQVTLTQVMRLNDTREFPKSDNLVDRCSEMPG